MKRLAILLAITLLLSAWLAASAEGATYWATGNLSWTATNCWSTSSTGTPVGSYVPTTSDLCNLNGYTVSAPTATVLSAGTLTGAGGLSLNYGTAYQNTNIGVLACSCSCTSGTIWKVSSGNTIGSGGNVQILSGAYFELNSNQLVSVTSGGTLNMQSGSAFYLNSTGNTLSVGAGATASIYNLQNSITPGTYTLSISPSSTFTLYGLRITPSIAPAQSNVYTGTSYSSLGTSYTGTFFPHWPVQSKKITNQSKKPTKPQPKKQLPSESAMPSPKRPKIVITIEDNR